MYIVQELIEKYLELFKLFDVSTLDSLLRSLPSWTADSALNGSSLSRAELFLL